MAKKTFALELKDGIEVKTIEELRENFDLEKVVEYFKDGRLLEWLEDHFYDDEAEAIESIEVDDKNTPQKICAALNVECDEDLEFTQRIREKKAILSEKIDDQTIIDNATTTALNQDDLANLLHMDYKKIYLCGELFNVPIRMTDMNYVGILGTPKIKIKANSDEELKAKNIKFENCQLPWQKTSVVDELKSLFRKIFNSDGEWLIVKDGEKVSTYNQLDKIEKSAALKMVCQGNYDENQIVYMQLNDDLSSGFALTVDSFCTGGAVGSKIFKYKDIKNTNVYKNRYDKFGISIDGTYYTYSSGTIIRLSSDNNNMESVTKLFGYDERIYEALKKFLDIAKNF